MVAYSSLNGLPFGEAQTVEELEELYYVVGVSRSNYDTVASRDVQLDRTGYTIATFGMLSSQVQLEENVFAGDKVMWSFPSLQQAKALMRVKSTSQVPREKLMIRLSALDWSHLHYLISNVSQLFLRKANDIGISRRLGSFGNVARYEAKHSKINADPKIKTAHAMKTHAMTVATKAIEVLAMRGIVKIMTPYEKKKEAAKDALLIELFKMFNDTVLIPLSADSFLDGTTSASKSTPLQPDSGPPNQKEILDAFPFREILYTLAEGYVLFLSELPSFNLSQPAPNPQSISMSSELSI